MRQAHGISGQAVPHWVGDGFPVRTLLRHDPRIAASSPFLLLDHAGPADFPPGLRRRGVGSHPHRGFETVTIVHAGEVAHRDSTGKGGVIGPGDVQWMTAAAGILHQEYHSDAFVRRGGTLEMVQLWVNLPRAHKDAPPGYQHLTADSIPVVALADHGGQLRVIAGRYGEARGPARTFTPLQVWDLRLRSGHRLSLPMATEHHVFIVVLSGSVQGAGQTADASRSLYLTPGADEPILQAREDSTVLILAGAPIDEPVVMHGPFVMSTEAEIEAAILDFHSGRFGAIPSAAAP